MAWFLFVLFTSPLAPRPSHPVVWAQEGDEHRASKPKRTEPEQDIEALKKLDKKLDRVLASLEALQKQLDAVKEELQIVKVRCTR